MKTKNILFILLLVGACISFFLGCFAIKKQPDPKPETETGKIIGESMQKNPSNWYVEDHSNWPITNSKYKTEFTVIDTICFIEVYVLKTSYENDSFNGFVIKYKPTSYSVELTERDCEYISYQFNHFIYPVILARVEKEKLEAERSLKLEQDSLNQKLIKDLKGCL